MIILQRRFVFIAQRLRGAPNEQGTVHARQTRQGRLCDTKGKMRKTFRHLIAVSNGTGVGTAMGHRADCTVYVPRRPANCCPLKCMVIGPTNWNVLGQE